MCRLYFPCVVVVGKLNENKKREFDFFEFRDEYDFFDNIEKEIKAISENIEERIVFRLYEEKEDVEGEFGDDRDAWPEELKKATFPVLYIVDEKNNVILLRKEDACETNFWIEICRKEKFLSFEVISDESGAKDWCRENWRQSSEMMFAATLVGWDLFD